jgi:hypothetical protein
MDREGPATTDARARTEISRLRTEVNELELRLMGRIVHLAWLWVIAITLASLALAAAFVGALHKP